MAETTGIFTDKITSTASSPHVNYSAAYTATRNDPSDKAVRVVLTCIGWLPSSASRLGSGIKLTVCARLNGGEWQSAVMKSTSAVWNGSSAKHAAVIELSGNVPSGSAKIEWYVTRSGSTYGGSAGILGSASRPKQYTAALPAYGGNDDGSGSADAKGCVYIRVGGVWKRAVSYIKINGVWKKAVPYVKSGGVWKKTS